MQSTAPVDKGVLRAEATPQPADRVDLKIYHRQGSGPDAHLSAVTREVRVNDNLPHTALTLLLKGPGKGDPKSLRAALPTTARVLSLTVRDGTAAVLLSREAVAHAARVGKREEHEAMALAAVANTLTEFPDIRRVRLRIRGQRGGRFWGAWGVPEVLVRDESLIDPAMRGPYVPPLAGFSHRRQKVGVPHRRKPPKVEAVRVQSQATFVRITVEVTAAHGGALRGPVPPTSVRHTGRKRVVLAVRGRPGKKVAGDMRDKLNDPSVKAARVDVRSKPAAVVVQLRPRRRSEFWLHTLPEPARIVLDIRR